MLPPTYLHSPSPTPSQYGGFLLSQGLGFLLYRCFWTTQFYICVSLVSPAWPCKFLLFDVQSCHVAALAVYEGVAILLPQRLMC